MELVVLSVSDEDIREYMGDETVDELEEKGLMGAALERARKFMWNSIDCSDWFSDSVCEAVNDVLRWG